MFKLLKLTTLLLVLYNLEHLPCLAELEPMIGENLIENCTEEEKKEHEELSEKIYEHKDQINQNAHDIMIINGTAEMYGFQTHSLPYHESRITEHSAEAVAQILNHSPNDSPVMGQYLAIKDQIAAQFVDNSEAKDEDAFQFNETIKDAALETLAKLADPGTYHNYEDDMNDLP